MGKRKSEKNRKEEPVQPCRSYKENRVIRKLPNRLSLFPAGLEVYFGAAIVYARTICARRY